MDEMEDVPAENVPAPPPHVDGALMISFGAVHPGREALAVNTFVELSRYLGRLMDAGLIYSFKPYFFADGQVGDISGFFLLEGRRESLEDVRREEPFQRIILRTGAATRNVRTSILVAGSEAGRLVNLYREIREELGLL